MTTQKKDLDYYLNLNWTIIEGDDVGFDGDKYYFIEIKEIPSFLYCAKTPQKAKSGYKEQLKWTIQVMLDMDEEISEP